MSKAKIISTIFIICLSLFPLNNIDIIIAVFLILSLGLVHGACDITLISTKLNTSSIKIKTGFIILYVFIAFGLCGFMALRLYGFMPFWLHGFMGLWVYEFMDLSNIWVYRFIGVWVYRNKKFGFCKF